MCVNKVDSILGDDFIHLKIEYFSTSANNEQLKGNKPFLNLYYIYLICKTTVFVFLIRTKIETKFSSIIFEPATLPGIFTMIG